MKKFLKDNPPASAQPALAMPKALLAGMLKALRAGLLYIIGGILVLGLFSLRFVNLTILPIFADEAIYIRWAQIMKAEETLRFLPLSDGKQPFFMWTMIPFLKFVSDPLVAGRLLSVFSGLGTMLGISFLSYLLFKSKKVALVAGFIYAVSPFTFFFDRMSLVDSMLSMFGVWTFILAYLSITKSRLDFAILAGFTLGGAWLTKSPALFFALMLPTLLLFASKKKYLVSIFYLLVTVLIGYGFYNILRLGPNFSMIARRNLDYVYPISHLLTNPFDPLRPFLIESWQRLVAMGPWLILVLGLIGLLVNWKKNWKQMIVLSIWFLAPIVIQSEFAKVLTARYILFTIPFLIIIASSAFLPSRKNWDKIVFVILVLFTGQSLVFDCYLLTDPSKANLPRSERSGYLEEWTAGQGIAQVASYLRNFRLQNSDTKIVIGTEGYFGTLPDGLQIYLNDVPQITVIGVGLNLTEVPTSLVDSHKFGDETFLVINQSRLLAEPSKIGLTLINSYPKAVRPDGSYDNLLLLKVTP